MWPAGFCLALVLASARPPTAANTAFVVTETAKCQARSDPDSPVLFTVPLGTSIELLEERKRKSADSDKDFEGWVRVRSGKKEGWTRSTAVSRPIEIARMGDRVLAWSAHPPDVEGCCGLEIHVLDVSTRKHRSFLPQGRCSNAYFSPSLKYVAIDDGTDALGSLDFYLVATGKRVHGVPSYPRVFEGWVAETTSYAVVDGTNAKGCTTLREEIFDDGAVRAGTRRGTMPDHGSSLCLEYSFH